MIEARKVVWYEDPDVRLCTFRSPRLGWIGEAREDGNAGRVVGLVWQSGYYFTRRGARNALRSWLATGSPHAEVLWGRFTPRLPRRPRLRAIPAGNGETPGSGVRGSREAGEAGDSGGDG